MQILKLYSEAPTTLIDSERPRPLDSGCRRCDRHQGAQSVCMKADGKTGGILIVGEFPSGADDRVGRPFTGDVGNTVRRLVQQYAPGEPVVFDYAVRCPGDRVSARANLDQCRGYLAQVIADVQPTRIIVLGPTASQAITGRAISAGSVHRAYSWAKVGERTVPVYILPDPMGAARNRFLRRDFAADMQWALTTYLQPDVAVIGGITRVISNAEESRAAVDHLRRAGSFTLDAEWAGKPFNRSFRMLAFCAVPEGSKDAYSWGAEEIYNPEINEPLKHVLMDRKVKKCGHGIKADVLASYAAWGIWMRGVDFDTLLVGKMLDGETSGYLEDAAERVGMGGHKEELAQAQALGLERFRKWLKDRNSGQASLFAPRVRRLINEDDPPMPEYPQLSPALAKELEEILGQKKGEPRSHSFALVPQPTLLAYNARDTVATSLLGVDLKAEAARNPPLARAWENLLRPAVTAVAQVEAWGVAVDREAAQNLSEYLTLQQAEIGQQFVPYGFNPADPTGGKFSPTSDRDVAELLYDRLKFPVVSKTETGQRQVTEEILEQLDKQRAHPVLKGIIQYRQLGKRRATYVDAIRRFVRDDGRIHGNINLDGTRTGRLSIDNPSLQNFPRASSELGRLIRNLFVSSPGHVLLELDYSQVELRIAAGLSGDPEMLALFASGMDFHMRTAEMISQLAWGISPAQWAALPPERKDYYRTLAKTVNFGLLFGKDEYGLSFELNCTVELARKIKDAILGKFKVLAKWIQEQVQKARTEGGVWTWWDGQPCRWRPLYEVAEPNGFNDQGRSTAERSSYNTPIQGTANEFCLRSLVQCTEWITEENIPAKLVLTIHDALYFDVREDALDELHLAVQGIMTGHRTPANVPLIVDAKVGRQLGQMEKRKLKLAA